MSKVTPSIARFPRSLLRTTSESPESVVGQPCVREFDEFDIDAVYNR